MSVYCDVGSVVVCAPLMPFRSSVLGGNRLALSFMVIVAVCAPAPFCASAGRALEESWGTAAAAAADGGFACNAASVLSWPHCC
jgi:hypothetical protein